MYGKGLGWGKREAGGWMPMPARPQLYCDPASRVISRALRDSAPRFVPKTESVGRSIIFHFFYFFGICGQLLHYCSCPNAWYAFYITAPAHLHTTRVAVYPALFLSWPKNHVSSCPIRLDFTKGSILILIICTRPGFGKLASHW